MNATIVDFIKRSKDFDDSTSFQTTFKEVIEIAKEYAAEQVKAERERMYVRLTMMKNLIDYPEEFEAALETLRDELRGKK